MKSFLRARRAGIAPEEIGLPRGRRRLTPGLRREELAAVADVGVTWYTWLEQGRNIRVSAEALRRIARALRLSVSDEAYLFALAEVEQVAAPVEWQMSASVHALMDGIGIPAFVLDPLFETLARNELAARLYGPHSSDGAFAGNFLWNVFANPDWRRRYVSFEISAPNLVGLFRSSYAGHIEDPRFDLLITSLSAASNEFAAMWNSRVTAPLTAAPFEICHEDLGALSFYSNRFEISDGRGVLLFLLSPADAKTRARIDEVRCHPKRKTSK